MTSSTWTCFVLQDSGDPPAQQPVRLVVLGDVAAGRLDRAEPLSQCVDVGRVLGDVLDRRVIPLMPHEQVPGRSLELELEGFLVVLFLLAPTTLRSARRFHRRRR